MKKRFVNPRYVKMKIKKILNKLSEVDNRKIIMYDIKVLKAEGIYSIRMELYADYSINELTLYFKNFEEFECDKVYELYPKGIRYVYVEFKINKEYEKDFGIDLIINYDVLKKRLKEIFNIRQYSKFRGF